MDLSNRRQSRALAGYRRRRVRSLLRSGFHRRAVVSQEDPADVSPDADPTVPVERAEREKIVEAALNKLGPEHRAVVVLKDFDGHRYEEISAILDVPVGTVRSRLHRARSELRERLRGLVDLEEPVRQGSSFVP